MRLLGALLVSLCACKGASAPQRPPNPGCGTVDLKVGDECHIVETTNPSFGKMHVGVGNIFERELPGADGKMEKRMSAKVDTFDTETKEEQSHTVIVGTELTLGKEHYRVTAVDYGKDAPGTITLKRLP